jgi:hypothetical protein
MFHKIPTCWRCWQINGLRLDEKQIDYVFIESVYDFTSGGYRHHAIEKQEHHNILELLIAKEGKTAAKQMQQHIRKQREYVINNILNKQDGMPQLNPLVIKKKSS